MISMSHISTRTSPVLEIDEIPPAASSNCFIWILEPTGLWDTARCLRHFVKPSTRGRW
ncbi:hypothetical protein BGZ61DRAFT_439556 [Ilyonectria robusta]|uniref:uncharacterized protein n=1 Tax=Ilyonectria robusta TaxID=1079257 RepID=UPI001E8E1DEA|nr:uncharacterized protein BGZ61DRAFT_439556 [Ilyonectria robusta]KAH8738083.1 hypothetical protein BGZ61DRAFT_439556 [Ilyonectria robusta]